jgi:hypothetical protein
VGAAALHSAPNLVEHGVGLRQNLVCPKPQHAESLSGKPVCPALVCAPLLQVLAAVDLDDEPGAQTNEVQDEGPQRVLPSKFDAQLLKAQAAPEATLGVGQGAAEVAGELAGFGGGLVLHGVQCEAAPPPPPSPRGGGGPSACLQRRAIARGSLPPWGRIGVGAAAVPNTSNPLRHGADSHQLRTGLPVCNIPITRSCDLGFASRLQKCLRSSAIR